MVQKILIYRRKGIVTSGSLGHAGTVVSNLMENYLDKGYVLYTDNFYNSVSLAELMTQRSTHLCGTLRFDRKENPKVLTGTKLKKGEMVWRRSDEVVVCKGKDKRDVLTITNMHQPGIVDVTSKNGKVAKKPNIIRAYNNGMSGVDRSDQMLAYYSYSKKTLRWYKKIGSHIFEIMIHNGHKMFCMLKNDGDRKMALLQFRIAAVHHLLGENFPRESTTVQLQPDEVFHYLAPKTATGTKSKPTRKC